MEYQLVQLIGLVLVHFIWQGILIGLLFGAGRVLAGAGSATTRYSWAVVCLLLLALAPLLTFAWLWSRTDVSAASGLAVMSERVQAGTMVSASDQVGLTLALAPLLPWIVGLWLGGVLLMSARLGAGWWYVAQLRRRADYAVPAFIRSTLDRLADRLQVSGSVSVALSSQIAGPMLIGLIKPMILLPTGLINGLSARQVEMVLAHELAHFKRADHLVNLFQNVVETLLFYHPVVRWISSEVRAERELVSDEQAAALTGDRLAYAETLLQLEKVRGDRLPLAVGMADHQLANRVRYLLALRSGQSGSVIFGMSLLTVALVGAMTALASTGWSPFPERDITTTDPVVAVQAPVEVQPESTGLIPVDRNETADSVEPLVEPLVETVAATPANADSIPADDLPLPETSDQALAMEASAPAIEQPVAVAEPVAVQDAPMQERRQAQAVEPQSPESPAPSEPLSSERLTEQGLMMASLARPTAITEVRGGQALTRTVPEYPLSAARRGLEGQAEVRLTVGPDGRVTSVVLVEESPTGYGFGEAALEAVEQWRFEPFTRDGRPVRHELQTGFDFTDPPKCGRLTGSRISRC